jgi:hypothetical protein
MRGCVGADCAPRRVRRDRPNEPAFYVRAMEQAARAFERRIRAVDQETGRVVDVWT